MSEKHKKTYTADFLLLLITGGVPFGWQMSGLPPSIVAACICWGTTLLVAMRIIWKWTDRWELYWRLTVLIVILATVLYCVWNPVKRQYVLERHPAAILETKPVIQWYLKINKVSVTPEGPNDTQVPFRLEAFVNGQVYGYPSKFAWINGETETVESWPLSIADNEYQIRFDGFLERFKIRFANLSGKMAPTFKESELPIRTNYAVEAVDPVTPASLQTTLSIQYEITTNR